MCPTQQDPTELPWLGLFSAAFLSSPFSSLLCLLSQMAFTFSPNSFKNTTWEKLFGAFCLGSSSIIMLESSQNCASRHFSAASRHDHISRACYLWLIVAIVLGGIPRRTTWDRIQIHVIFFEGVLFTKLYKELRETGEGRERAEQEDSLRERPSCPWRKETCLWAPISVSLWLWAVGGENGL